MISKERLKELINQKAIIYFVYHGYVDWKEGKYKNDFILCEDYVSIYWTTRSHQIKYEELFETREDAEWYNEFGNIHRVEKLSLPTWEEFNKIEFYTKTARVIFEKTIESYPIHPDIEEEQDYEFIQIWELTFDGGDILHYHELATKENYLDACRICKDLFLGEEGE